MRDDIWTDIAGPWCFVAKARFDQGLGALAHRDQPEVVHRSYELEPRAENGDVPIIDAVAAPCGRTGEQQFPVVDRRLSAKFSRKARSISSLWRPQVGLAVEAELDGVEARQVLDNPAAFADEVRADERLAAEPSAGGVPSFVLNRRYGVTGVQPPETFTRALDQAWADHRAA
ncbi:Predicted dithiol-disulfide isomerase, DsbA family [Streptomyces sp. 1222.5]|nr:MULTISPECIES: DsbA family protein [unclassified Streptomyces]PKW05384.1 putative DsbA family dithiol-disulfide isomerase [Streptomyces sp. 5112.2]SED41390.1 Predicted dithiol-disulfide isomerase, DsbA family [Streptomyces sp. 1222.5]